MRVSHFAKLEVIVPPSDYSVGNRTAASLRTVGMAQNINIDDNFGSRAENTIGSPLPVLAPGYQQTTLSIEKATIDGADFRNLGAFNPLWAHVGETYQLDSAGTAAISVSPADAADAATRGMYPFMFILRTRNKISDSAEVSNINENNTPGPLVAPDVSRGNRANSFGVYACVLQSATISANSNQAVIMDRVTAIARPISGTWLNNKIKDAFSSAAGTTGPEDLRNGMATVIYDVLYGYIS
jgi:hypothetical protein